MADNVKSFQLSDERINSYGFKVKTEGIDYTSVFAANPVMLYEHKSIDLLGSWSNPRIEGGALKADAVFDDGDEFATKISGKVDRGFLKGVSIGIQIVETAEELTAEGAKVPVVSKSILMEASLCAIPSNANSLRLYNSKGVLMSTEEAKLTIAHLTNPEATPPTSITKSQNTDTMKLTAENLQALGLSADADESAINAALAKSLAAQKTAQATADKAKADAVAALVDGAITDGRIKAEQKEHYQKLATADMEATSAILAAISKPTKPTDHVKTGGKKTDLSSREDWDLEKWRKEDPKGLLSLKEDEPEQYAELLSGSSIKNHLKV